MQHEYVRDDVFFEEGWTEDEREAPWHILA